MNSGHKGGQIYREGAKKMNSLISAFNEYFEVMAADTPELQQQVFQLRYRVYCEEMRFFDPNDYPNRLECDEYDRRSAHYLLRHRGRDEYVGSVRLILPNSNNPEELFPLEVHTAGQFYPDAFSPAHIPRIRIAEISRLILSRSLRSRPGEYASPYGTAENIATLPPIGRRHFPHPVLGLFLAIMRISAVQGISYWYAAMEPVLNRLLRRFNVQLQPIGPVVQYHGARQPFFGAIDNVLQRTYEQSRDVWSLITESGSLWPPPRLAA